MQANNKRMVFDFGKILKNNDFTFNISAIEDCMKSAIMKQCIKNELENAIKNAPSEVSKKADIMLKRLNQGLEDENIKYLSNIQHISSNAKLSLDDTENVLKVFGIVFDLSPELSDMKSAFLHDYKKYFPTRAESRDLGKKIAEFAILNRYLVPNPQVLDNIIQLSKPENCAQGTLERVALTKEVMKPSSLTDKVEQNLRPTLQQLSNQYYIPSTHEVHYYTTGLNTFLSKVPKYQDGQESNNINFYNTAIYAHAPKDVKQVLNNVVSLDIFKALMYDKIKSYAKYIVENPDKLGSKTMEAMSVKESLLFIFQNIIQGSNQNAIQISPGSSDILFTHSETLINTVYNEYTSEYRTTEEIKQKIQDLGGEKAFYELVFRQCENHFNFILEKNAKLTSLDIPKQMNEIFKGISDILTVSEYNLSKIFLNLSPFATNLLELTQKNPDIFRLLPNTSTSSHPLMQDFTNLLKYIQSIHKEGALYTLTKTFLIKFQNHLTDQIIIDYLDYVKNEVHDIKGLTLNANYKKRIEDFCNMVSEDTSTFKTDVLKKILREEKISLESYDVFKKNRLNVAAKKINQELASELIDRVFDKTVNLEVPIDESFFINAKAKQARINFVQFFNNFNPSYDSFRSHFSLSINSITPKQAWEKFGNFFNLEKEYSSSTENKLTITPIKLKSIKEIQEITMLDEERIRGMYNLLYNYFHKEEIMNLVVPPTKVKVMGVLSAGKVQNQMLIGNHALFQERPALWDELQKHMPTLIRERKSLNMYSEVGKRIFHDFKTDYPPYDPLSILVTNMHILAKVKSDLLSIVDNVGFVEIGMHDLFVLLRNPESPFYQKPLSFEKPDSKYLENLQSGKYNEVTTLNINIFNIQVPQSIKYIDIFFTKEEIFGLFGSHYRDFTNMKDYASTVKDSIYLMYGEGGMQDFQKYANTHLKKAVNEEFNFKNSPSMEVLRSVGILFGYDTLSTLVDTKAIAMKLSEQIINLGTFDQMDDTVKDFFKGVESDNLHRKQVANWKYSISAQIRENYKNTIDFNTAKQDIQRMKDVDGIDTKIIYTHALTHYKISVIMELFKEDILNFNKMVNLLTLNYHLNENNKINANWIMDNFFTTMNVPLAIHEINMSNSEEKNFLSKIANAICQNIKTKELINITPNFIKYIDTYADSNLSKQFISGINFGSFNEEFFNMENLSTTIAGKRKVIEIFQDPEFADIFTQSAIDYIVTIPRLKAKHSFTKLVLSPIFPVLNIDDDTLKRLLSHTFITELDALTDIQNINKKQFNYWNTKLLPIALRLSSEHKYNFIKYFTELAVHSNFSVPLKHLDNNFFKFVENDLNLKFNLPSLFKTYTALNGFDELWSIISGNKNYIEKYSMMINAMFRNKPDFIEQAFSVSKNPDNLLAIQAVKDYITSLPYDKVKILCLKYPILLKTIVGSSIITNQGYDEYLSLMKWDYNPKDIIFDNKNLITYANKGLESKNRKFIPDGDEFILSAVRGDEYIKNMKISWRSFWDAKNVIFHGRDFFLSWGKFSNEKKKYFIDKIIDIPRFSILNEKLTSLGIMPLLTDTTYQFFVDVNKRLAKPKINIFNKKIKPDIRNIAKMTESDDIFLKSFFYNTDKLTLDRHKITSEIFKIISAETILVETHNHAENKKILNSIAQFFPEDFLSGLHPAMEEFSIYRDATLKAIDGVSIDFFTQNNDYSKVIREIIRKKMGILLWGFSEDQVIRILSSKPDLLDVLPIPISSEKINHLANYATDIELRDKIIMTSVKAKQIELQNTLPTIKTTITVEFDKANHKPTYLFEGKSFTEFDEIEDYVKSKFFSVCGKTVVRNKGGVNFCGTEISTSEITKEKKYYNDEITQHILSENEKSPKAQLKKPLNSIERIKKIPKMTSYLALQYASFLIEPSWAGFAMLVQVSGGVLIVSKTGKAVFKPLVASGRTSIRVGGKIGIGVAENIIGFILSIIEINQLTEDLKKSQNENQKQVSIRSLAVEVPLLIIDVGGAIVSIVLPAAAPAVMLFQLSINFAGVVTKKIIRTESIINEVNTFYSDPNRFGLKNVISKFFNPNYNLNERVARAFYHVLQQMANGPYLWNQIIARNNQMECKTHILPLFKIDGEVTTEFNPQPIRNYQLIDVGMPKKVLAQGGHDREINNITIISASELKSIEDSAIEPGYTIKYTNEEQIVNYEEGRTNIAQNGIPLQNLYSEHAAQAPEFPYSDVILATSPAYLLYKLFSSKKEEFKNAVYNKNSNLTTVCTPHTLNAIKYDVSGIITEAYTTQRVEDKNRLYKVKYAKLQNIRIEKNNNNPSCYNTLILQNANEAITSKTNRVCGLMNDAVANSFTSNSDIALILDVFILSKNTQVKINATNSINSMISMLGSNSGKGYIQVKDGILNLAGMTFVKNDSPNPLHDTQHMDVILIENMLSFFRFPNDQEKTYLSGFSNIILPKNMPGTVLYSKWSSVKHLITNGNKSITVGTNEAVIECSNNDKIFAREHNPTLIIALTEQNSSITIITDLDTKEQWRTLSLTSKTIKDIKTFYPVKNLLHIEFKDGKCLNIKMTTKGQKFNIQFQDAIFNVNSLEGEGFVQINMIEENLKEGQILADFDKMTFELPPSNTSIPHCLFSQVKKNENGENKIFISSAFKDNINKVIPSISTNEANENTKELIILLRENDMFDVRLAKNVSIIIEPNAKEFNNGTTLLNLNCNDIASSNDVKIFPSFFLGSESDVMLTYTDRDNNTISNVILKKYFNPETNLPLYPIEIKINHRHQEQLLLTKKDGDIELDSIPSAKIFSTVIPLGAKGSIPQDLFLNSDTKKVIFEVENIESKPKYYSQERDLCIEIEKTSICIENFAFLWGKNFEINLYASTAAKDNINPSTDLILFANFEELTNLFTEAEPLSNILTKEETYNIYNIFEQTHSNNINLNHDSSNRIQFNLESLKIIDAEKNDKSLIFALQEEASNQVKVLSITSYQEKYNIFLNHSGGILDLDKIQPFLKSGVKKVNSILMDYYNNASNINNSNNFRQEEDLKPSVSNFKPSSIEVEAYDAEDKNEESKDNYKYIRLASLNYKSRFVDAKNDTNIVIDYSNLEEFGDAEYSVKSSAFYCDITLPAIDGFTNYNIRTAVNAKVIFFFEKGYYKVPLNGDSFSSKILNLTDIKDFNFNALFSGNINHYKAYSEVNNTLTKKTFNLPVTLGSGIFGALATATIYTLLSDKKYTPVSIEDGRLTGLKHNNLIKTSIASLVGGILSTIPSILYYTLHGQKEITTMKEPSFEAEEDIFYDAKEDNYTIGYTLPPYIPPNNVNAMIVPSVSSSAPQNKGFINDIINSVGRFITNLPYVTKPLQEDFNKTQVGFFNQNNAVILPSFNAKQEYSKQNTTKLPNQDTTKLLQEDASNPQSEFSLSFPKKKDVKNENYIWYDGVIYQDKNTTCTEFTGQSFTINDKEHLVEVYNHHTNTHCETNFPSKDIESLETNYNTYYKTPHMPKFTESKIPKDICINAAVSTSSIEAKYRTGAKIETTNENNGTITEIISTKKPKGWEYSFTSKNKDSFFGGVGVDGETEILHQKFTHKTKIPCLNSNNENDCSNIQTLETFTKTSGLPLFNEYNRTLPEDLCINADFSTHSKYIELPDGKKIEIKEYVENLKETLASNQRYNTFCNSFITSFISTIPDAFDLTEKSEKFIKTAIGLALPFAVYGFSFSSCFTAASKLLSNHLKKKYISDFKQSHDFLTSSDIKEFNENFDSYCKKIDRFASIANYAVMYGSSAIDIFYNTQFSLVQELLHNLLYNSLGSTMGSISANIIDTIANGINYGINKPSNLSLDCKPPEEVITEDGRVFTTTTDEEKTLGGCFF
jgi:hypothetical protein